MTKAVKNPMEDYDFSGDAGAGFEGTDGSDFKVAYMQIVQAGSPELKKQDAKFIEGATVGAIYNSVTREVLGGDGEPVTVVPCMYRKLFMEWRTRENGGGLVEGHASEAILEQCQRDDKNRDILPNGNQVVTTAYMAALVVKDGATTPVVITFKSTQLKKVRAWMTAMRSIKMTGKEGNTFVAPMFSYKWNLSTVFESNDQGDWYGWRIENAGPVDKVELILEAKQAKEETLALSTGDVKQLEAHNTEESTSADDEGVGDFPPRQDQDEF